MYGGLGNIHQTAPMNRSTTDIFVIVEGQLDRVYEIFKTCSSDLYSHLGSRSLSYFTVGTDQPYATHTSMLAEKIRSSNTRAVERKRGSSL